jgi:hypothetical protein
MKKDIASSVMSHPTLPFFQPSASRPTPARPFSGSELPPRRDPRLQRLVRHSAYLGDLACGVGAALLTGNPIAALVPAGHLLFLVRQAIPEAELRRRLRRPWQPGGSLRAWRLIPFVY